MNRPRSACPPRRRSSERGRVGDRDATPLEGGEIGGGADAVQLDRRFDRRHRNRKSSGLERSADEEEVTRRRVAEESTCGAQRVQVEQVADGRSNPLQEL